MILYRFWLFSVSYTFKSILNKKVRHVVTTRILTKIKKNAVGFIVNAVRFIVNAVGCFSSYGIFFSSYGNLSLVTATERVIKIVNAVGFIVNAVGCKSSYGIFFTSYGNFFTSYGIFFNRNNTCLRDIF